MQEHNEGHMKALLAFASPMIVLSMYFIYWYLLQIEINKTLNLPTGLESVGSHEDFAKNKETSGDDDGLEKEVPQTNGAESDAVPVEAEEEKPRRFRITKLRNAVLLLTSLALSLLTYLLLVVSNASLWLSLLGVAAVIGIGLWQQISEELRRQRLDRIVAIITLVFLTASFMSLATYANKSLQEGEVYQGKARIIGFDYDSYDNNQGDITRTDLEVAWGGEWGCPTEGGKQCQSFVQGAMCESEKENDNGGRFRRFLNDNDNNNGDANNNAEGDGNDNDANNNNDGQDNDEENLEEENEELEEEEEDMEEDMEEEEEANEELEEENEELEEYAEELEEEVISEETYTYYWDDDLLYDSYWDEQDWTSVWGEYACEDLFDYDLSGGTFNADEVPGDDNWPFVNIYGNCKKCEAYIVDYFSTEHFQSIQDYRIQGRNYLIFSLFGLMLTGLLHFKHRMDPIAEKELELLPHDGGAMA